LHLAGRKSIGAWGNRSLDRLPCPQAGAVRGLLTFKGFPEFGNMVRTASSLVVIQ
jgi:hypothetical protein